MGAFELMNFASGSLIRDIFTLQPRPKIFEEFTTTQSPVNILLSLNEIMHKFHPVHFQKKFDPTVGVFPL